MDPSRETNKVQSDMSSSEKVSSNTCEKQKTNILKTIQLCNNLLSGITWSRRVK